MWVNFLISEGEYLPVECPGHLQWSRIENCQSKTYFMVYTPDNIIIRVEGWSNSAVMRGIIIIMIKIFNLCNPMELQQTGIDFHIKSGLIDNLTPMRRDALEEMIRRITTLW